MTFRAGVHRDTGAPGPRFWRRYWVSGGVGRPRRGWPSSSFSRRYGWPDSFPGPRAAPSAGRRARPTRANVPVQVKDAAGRASGSAASVFQPLIRLATCGRGCLRPSRPVQRNRSTSASPMISGRQVVFDGKVDETLRREAGAEWEVRRRHIAKPAGSSTGGGFGGGDFAYLPRKRNNALRHRVRMLRRCGPFGAFSALGRLRSSF